MDLADWRVCLLFAIIFFLVLIHVFQIILVDLSPDLEVQQKLTSPILQKLKLKHLDQNSIKFRWLNIPQSPKETLWLQ